MLVLGCPLANEWLEAAEVFGGFGGARVFGGNLEARGSFVVFSAFVETDLGVGNEGTLLLLNSCFGVSLGATDCLVDTSVFVLDAPRCGDTVA